MRRPRHRCPRSPRRDVLDATIAWDDALCERFLTCLVCGQRQGVRSMDLVVVHGLPMTVSRCLPCAGKDKDGTQLIARLAAREAKPP